MEGLGPTHLWEARQQARRWQLCADQQGRLHETDQNHKTQLKTLPWLALSPQTQTDPVRHTCTRPGLLLTQTDPEPHTHNRPRLRL